MWVTTVSAKNFRGLQDIDLSLNPQVNVIVGPNAIGKSTILEAIRFVKGVAAPRAPNEAQHTLTSLRAATPHQPQMLIPDGIARDPKLAVEVKCTFQLADEEIADIVANPQTIATLLLQSRSSFGNNIASFSNYMSSEMGKNALAEAERQIRTTIDDLKTAKKCFLKIKIDFTKNLMEGSDDTQVACFQYLERRLPPHLSLFSSFPADRALPPGEQPIQIGLQDAMQQLDSHNANPHTKYARVKNSIFNSVIMNDAERSCQLTDFQKIFDGLLRNRKIVGPSVNQHGQLSITIQDVDTGSMFDIDSMSSGEKNLVLTWLLIARSVAQRGIVLLDEPELHLNPAICKHILPFAIESYVKANGIQIIMCTHSPPILAGAFARPECSLYHLRSGNLITLVRPHDREELTEALRLLGTSEVEGLLYESTVFVEGEHDVDILDEGFGDLLRRHMLKDLGGRREIEKRIQSLQAAETAGEVLSPRHFVFDRDEAPTGLTPSSSVRFLQWKRRCLENYLLDVNAMTDALKGHEIDGQRITNVGQVQLFLQSLANEQLDDFAIRAVYQGYGYKDSGLRADDLVKKRSAREVGDILSLRIQDAQRSICGIEAEPWKQQFLSDVDSKRLELKQAWDTAWQTECDGKRLFRSLQGRVQLRMPILTFKKQIIRRMREDRSKLWQEVHDLLSALIKPPLQQR